MNGQEFLPFAVPDITEAEIAAVADAMRSGWITTGPIARKFEELFAQAVGSDVHAVSVNSATAGLHLALEALGIGDGDEVLVPTWTFTATAEVVRYLGATPVLVDVLPDTLNVDLADAAAKTTDKTRAIMPVHFAGDGVSPLMLEAFSADHGVHVVEDAAHAFPASASGVTIGGSASAATVFSFYATKTITTGEGGMVVTRDRALANRMRTMRLHGISRDVFDRYRSRRPAWQYEVIAPGYKYNLTDPAAAMGVVQLGRADSMRGRREQIASHYHSALGALGVQLPRWPEQNSRHAWHLYVIRLGVDGPDRGKFIERMSEAGVGTSVHFIPLHLHPYWRDLGGHRASDFPVASREYERVVSLPIYSSMTEADCERVVTAVTQALR